MKTQNIVFKEFEYIKTRFFENNSWYCEVFNDDLNLKFDHQIESNDIAYMIAGKFNSTLHNSKLKQIERVKKDDRMTVVYKLEVALIM